MSDINKWKVVFNDEGLLTERTLDASGTWTTAEAEAREAKQTSVGKATNNRREMYSPIGEQLDMLYHELSSTGTISNTGEWFTKIKEVKDTIPIPAPYDPYLDPTDPFYTG